tara:strand:- start:27 stop:617 length:591 start_codon:yes stop_codon:yes gene_type:complete
MSSFQINITDDYFVNTTIELLNTTTTSSSFAPPPYLTWKQLLFVTIGALLVGTLLSPILNIITKECCGISLCNICVEICECGCFHCRDGETCVDRRSCLGDYNNTDVSFFTNTKNRLCLCCSKKEPKVEVVELFEIVIHPPKVIDEECSICLETMKDNGHLGVLSCGHKFHARCIKTWTNEHNTCPLCRRETSFPK